jgi:hypothetical protein
MYFPSLAFILEATVIFVMLDRLAGEPGLALMRITEEFHASTQGT